MLTFYLKGVPAKFKNIWNIFLELSAGQVRQNCNATLVILPGTSVATIVTIWCHHCDGEYFLHRITTNLGSTATSMVITMLLHLTDYISGTENETLRALLGPTNWNIEMRSPSGAAMMTMVPAATTGFLSTHIPFVPWWRHQMKRQCRDREVETPGSYSIWKEILCLMQKQNWRRIPYVIWMRTLRRTKKYACAEILPNQAIHV